MGTFAFNQPAYERVPAELLEQLTRVGVCTATAELQNQGFRNTFMIGVRPLALDQQRKAVAGQAFTLRFLPLREDLVTAQYATLTGSPHRTALETVGHGDILVIDAGGTLETAVIGDIFTRRVHRRGTAAMVIDGVVRDLSAIKDLGFPIYGKGVHGAGIPRALMSVGMNEPIQCGGVPVMPGDVILADEDGVVAIPPQAVPKLIEDGLEHELQEVFIRQKIDQGATLHTAYPPDEATRREYEDWKAARQGRSG